MRAAGGFAFGNVRVRSRLPGLLGPDAAARLETARDRDALRAITAELGIAGTRGEDAQRSLFPALVDDYRRVLRSYPVGEDLVLALLRRHEVENLKVVLRGCARGLPSEVWLPLWRPLGTLESLRRESWADVKALAEVRERARGTPYAEVVEAAVTESGSHGSAELALDEWATRQIASAAQALPEDQADARALAMRVVRERDLELWLRRDAFGLAPDVAMAAAMTDQAPRATRAELRRMRLRACRRAFLGSPFRLAPAIAYLLLREEELKAVSALLEGWRRPEHKRDVHDALLASAMGG